MNDTPLPMYPPGFAPGVIPASTTVQVVANGITQFRFDPAFPNSTSTASFDPVLAETTEAALESALAKAKAITAACKSLAGE